METSKQNHKLEAMITAPNLHYAILTFFFGPPPHCSFFKCEKCGSIWCDYHKIFHPGHERACP